jgi:hypothetical protein
MATRDDIYQAIRNADKAGDSESVKKLAAYLQTMDANHEKIAAQIDNDAISQGARDTTAGMSTFDKAAAGAGQAVHGMVQGAGQLLGLTDRKDVQESRDRDAPLMATTPAKVGNLLGNLAMTAPAFLIPGAATVTGAGAIGAAQGLLAPSTSTTETAQNVGLGGVAGAGGVVAGKVLAGLYQGGKALAEPFYQAGRQKIAGRVIQRFADDPQAVAAARGGPSITGAVPTIAEETGDAGMARLQDAVRSVDPQIAGRIDARLTQNNAARVGKLQEMAGKDGARDFASEMRSGTAKDLYDRALSVRHRAGEPVARHARRSDEAAADAGDSGRHEGGPAERTEPRHEAGQHGRQHRRPPPDQAGDGRRHQRPQGRNGGAGEQGRCHPGRARPAGLLHGEDEPRLPGRSPDLCRRCPSPSIRWTWPANCSSAARRPTATSRRNQRLMPNALTKLVQDDGENLVKQATGRKGLGDLSKVMTPEQQNMLQAIVGEVDRTGAVARAGNGPGIGNGAAHGISEHPAPACRADRAAVSWAESALANTVVGKPLNLLYGGVAEPKIQQALAEAVLDPASGPSGAAGRAEAGDATAGQRDHPIAGQQRMRAAPSSAAVSRQR